MQTGVDIIEIDRIKKACERKNFINRFFTSRELENIKGSKSFYAHLAGKYAAKEAIVKAMGTGFRNMKWKDIEVLNEASGKPVAVLTGQAKKIFEQKNFKSISISVSHCKEYAVAFAIAIGGEADECSQPIDYEGDGSHRY